MRICWLETEDLYTVRKAQEAAIARGLELIPLHPTDLKYQTTKDRVGIFWRDYNVVDHFDVLIVRSFMPHISESLTLASHFFAAGKIVVDSGLATEGYCMSKMSDYLALAVEGIGVPQTTQLFQYPDAISAARLLGFPCVLKGIHGSEGRHVYKVDTEDQFIKIFHRYKAGELMVQEFLDADEDYRVMVVGYKAIDVYVARTPRPGDFRTNFEHQEKVRSMHLDQRDSIRMLAEAAAHRLGRQFAGVDIRCRGDVPLILEVNRRPGFKAFEEVTGYDVAGALVDYVVRLFNDRAA